MELLPKVLLQVSRCIMQYVASALAIVLAIVVLIFGFQNLESVSVSFLAWSTSLPKIFLILGSYIFGMLSGWGLLGLMKAAVN
jgi:uncharacterized integral membrane protein